VLSGAFERTDAEFLASRAHSARGVAGLARRFQEFAGGPCAPNDLFGFLTTKPNAEVGAIHPKAMTVILRTGQEIETWLTRRSRMRGSSRGLCRKAR
jgi:putative SOS response-associated peptidase YedK